jgi:hypothetical protein
VQVHAINAVVLAAGAPEREPHDLARPDPGVDPGASRRSAPEPRVLEGELLGRASDRDAAAGPALERTIRGDWLRSARPRPAPEPSPEKAAASYAAIARLRGAATGHLDVYA